jgi:hypothetical protein
MRRARKLRPSLESMESKQLLSGAGAGAGVVLAGTIPSAPVVMLGGMIHGSFHKPLGTPDVGAHYNLAGTGKLAHFGSTTLAGSLGEVGFIAQGNSTGTLTLANAKGSLTLSLTGPTQGGFSRLPTSYNFTVTASSGAYTNYEDTGHLTLHLGGAQGGHSTAPGLAGRFSIFLTSDRQAIPL